MVRDATGSPRGINAAADILKRYSIFQLECIRRLDPEIQEALNMPTSCVNAYLAGGIDEAARNAEADGWWDVLESSSELRAPSSLNAVVARIAIALLSVKEVDAENIQDHVEWFTELLRLAGLKSEEVARLLDQYLSGRDYGSAS